ncbi:hypothetical protein Tco_1253066 [Tanacetum coccineum]
MMELLFEAKLPQALQALCEKLNKYIQEKQEENNIAEEQAAKVSSQYWKPPIYYDDDDDDDEEYSIQVSTFYKKSPIAITPVLPTVEPEDSLSMGDEHLSTVPEKELDKVLKSSVENLNEGLEDIVSIPPGKEIDHLDAIPDLVQSLLSHANSIIFLIEEFTELNSEIPDTIIESFSPSLIPVEDSDSLMEEIDIFLAPDDSIPPGIENDDYDSEGDVLFLVELLNDDSLSLPDYESFHVDFYNVPSFPRPPEKPPDDDVYIDIKPDTGVLTTKVVDDISDNSTRELYFHVPNVLDSPFHPLTSVKLCFYFHLKMRITKLPHPGSCFKEEENLPHLLSHRGFKYFQLINVF